MGCGGVVLYRVGARPAAGLLVFCDTLRLFEFVIIPAVSIWAECLLVY